MASAQSAPGSAIHISRTANQGRHARLDAETRAAPLRCTRRKALRPTVKCSAENAAAPIRRRASDSRLKAVASEATTDEDPRVAAIMDSLKWDSTSGLLVAIAQNADTGDVMMQGFADRRAVAKTLLTGRATFFSRSRKTLWTKGESSGNFIQVLDVFVDCDRDTLIYLGLPDGPTCHTGEITCFYDKLEVDGSSTRQKVSPLSSLFAVENTILQRQQEMLQQQQEAATVNGTAGSEEQGKPKKPSWTQKLLSNTDLLCSKVREEADELCRTLEDSEGKERAASEMADLLYHSLVLLRVQGVMLEDVAAVLRSRFGKSGVEEKASRKKDVAQA